MYTKDELGLTQQQYDDLLAANTYPDWEVIAHRYNLDFGLAALAAATGISASATSITGWDSEDIGDYLFLANADKKVLRYQISSSMFTTITPSPAPAGTRMYLSKEGNRLYAWDFGSSLKRAYTDNYGSSWSAWETGPSLTGYSLMAPVGKNAHLLSVDSSKALSNLRYLDWPVGGSAVVTNSDLYWTFAIAAMDAVNITGTGASGVDVIVLDTEVPGPITARYDNTTEEAVNYNLRAGGLVSVLYDNNHWNPHDKLDVLDEINSYQDRQGVKLNSYGGMLYLTTWSLDGTQNFPFSYVRVYKSKDGKFWSIGNLLNIPGALGNVKLHRAGDYVYTFDGKQIWRSYSTLFTGFSPNNTDIQKNLTAYITEYNIAREQMAQATFTLDDSNGEISAIWDWLTGNDILFEHKAGYYIPALDETLLATIALTELESIDEDRSTPVVQFNVSARDPFSWLTDLTVAERAYLREGQFVGADNYVNDTNTNFGGMSSTEVLSGDWSTLQSGSTGLQFNASADTAEGIVFSTLKTEFADGVYKLRFPAGYLGDIEHVGMIFRGKNKNNFFFVDLEYSAGNITPKLYVRKNATDTLLATGTAFTNPTTETEFRLSFYYGSVAFAYRKRGSSSFGSTTLWGTWTTVLSTTMDYTGNSLTDNSYLVSSNKSQSGSVGIRCKRDSGSAAMLFSDLIVFGQKLPQTVSDAFRWFANLADIHGFKETDIAADGGTVPSFSGDVISSGTPVGDTSLLPGPVLVGSSGKYFGYSFSPKRQIRRIVADVQASGTGLSLFASGQDNQMYTFGSTPNNDRGSVNSGNNRAAPTTRTVMTFDLPIDGNAYTYWALDVVGDATKSITVYSMSFYDMSGSLVATQIPTGHSFLMNWNKSTSEVVSLGTTSPQEIYRLVFREDGNLIIDKLASGVWVSIFNGGYTYLASSTIQLAFWETQFGDSANSWWRIIVIWENGSPKDVYAESVSTPLASPVVVSLPSGATVTDLTDFIETLTLDPNESPIGGLQRAIDGRYVKFMMRGNGELKTWNPQVNDSLYEFDLGTVLNMGRSFDLRGFKSHVKQLGAYTWADTVRPDLIAKYRQRYGEISNPYLMSEAEASLQSSLSIKRLQEQLLKTTFNTPFTPLLEPEDHITINGEEYIIESIAWSFQPGDVIQTITARSYVFAS